MENNNDSFKKKVPIVRYNKELDQYDNVILFPHKVAKAKEMLKKFGLPDMNNISAEQPEKK